MRPNIRISVLLVLLAAVSCRKEFVPAGNVREGSGEEVYFGCPVETRMSDVTSLAGTGFYVTGLYSSDGGMFMPSQHAFSNGGVYRTKNRYYFPEDGPSIRFYAGYPLPVTNLSGTSYGIAGFDPKVSLSVVENRVVQLLDNNDFVTDDNQFNLINCTASFDEGRMTLASVDKDKDAWAAAQKTFPCRNGDVIVVTARARMVNDGTAPSSVAFLLGNNASNVRYLFDGTLAGWQDIALIWTCPEGDERRYYVEPLFNNPYGTQLEYDWINVFNLTDIYGSGNEPSLTDFLKDVPLRCYSTVHADYPVQVFQDGDFADGPVYGIVSTNSSSSLVWSDGVYTYTDHTAPTDLAFMGKTVPVTLNHKYLAVEKVRYTSVQSTRHFRLFLGGNTNNTVTYLDPSTTEWQIVAAELDHTVDEDVVFEMLRTSYTASDGVSAQVDWVCLYDLTAMYGRGNEPSKEAFLKRYGHRYYPYTTDGTVTVSSTQAFEHDLLAASATGSSSPVNLVFDHILTKIQVNVKPADNDFTYKLRSIDITVPDTGDYDIGAGRWDTDGTYQWHYFSGELAVPGDGYRFTSANTCIPGDLVFTATWDCYYGGVKKASYTKSSGGVHTEPGDNFTYNITLTCDASAGESLVIVPVLQGWDDGGTIRRVY